MIKISCLNVNCRGGCLSFGGGWDLKYSWLKLTRVKFHWMGSSSSFFNLSHHPKYVVGTRTTRKAYKKWSNIDLPLFKNTQLMGWHDLNSSVVLAYFLLFQWPLNTMVWNYKLTPWEDITFWFVCVIKSGCFRLLVIGWSRNSKKTLVRVIGFMMIDEAPFC